MVDTERLLKIVQEYSEHEYAPFVGGASLLAGAVVWFYATDISRAFKVSLVETDVPTSVLTFVFSIPPIVLVTSENRVRQPFLVRWKIPGSRVSLMGTFPNSTTVRPPTSPNRRSLQSPRMVTEYRQKFGPLYRVFCGDIPEM